MFSRILPVMRKEFIHIIRDPRTLAIMFVMPLMQLILLGYAATSDVRDIPLAVYDQDRSAASRQLISDFVQSGQFIASTYTSSERELAALIDAGRVRAGLIIPPAYAADLAGSHGAQVVFVIDGSDPTIASTALASARLIGQASASSIQQQIVAQRGGSFGALPLEVRTRVWYNPDMASAFFMIPGLTGLVLQFQATLLTATAIVRERERGTIEQLIVTPIRPIELILGKILPYAFVAVVIALEVLLIGTLWFGVPIKGDLALLLGITGIFLISTLGIGLLISTIANTQQEALLLTMFTLLPSVFLSGFIYPLSAL
ncbi:MAG TPA: ABC transporter permease, partial [Roseiflexaceae bacterium]|nr:ABC transporter permease [Roseiflexaceae bacterium]